MINYSKIVGIFSRVDEDLGNSSLLVSVRKGLTYMIPLLLIGSIALVFLSLPIPAYQNMMKEIFGDEWKNVFLYIRDGTFNILSLIMVLCISYSYIIELKEKYNHNVSPIIGCLVSLSSFIVVLGISKDNFSIKNFGVIGIFIAIIVAITSSMVFLKLSSLDFLKINAFTDGASSTFNYASNSIYPAAITIAVFAILNQILISVFGISDIQNFISNFFSEIFFKIKSPFWSGILFIFLIHILWFFGMHGSNILEPVAQSIFIPALAKNQTLVSLGQRPTNIFTKTFFDTFILMGGCGTVLCLVCAILIAGKYKNHRRLARLSSIPIIFNINELIVFGLPIVLNPVYLIPFLFTPIILTITSYLAVYSGLVPYTITTVEWTTPIFLSGYVATNSIKGSILQVFNLTLGILCYIPFVKLAESVSYIRMINSFRRVCTVFKENEEKGIVSTLISRNDDTGNISRFLTADLEYALKNNKVTLFYQPQVDYKGDIFGVEALLRWKHDIYGYIYPPLVIVLASEGHLMDKLSYWILNRVCSDLSKMNKLGFPNIIVSINMSVVQLENDYFVNNLEKSIKKHKIAQDKLEIEITEQIALRSSKDIRDRIMAMKKLGVRLAMDDFGMGHSSLMYLKEYEFDTIKLDGSLVREILYNNNCRDIIQSIVSLGKSLNYSVIAEYVEEEEQRDILYELGCHRYQGYLYSKPLNYDELIEYLLDKCESKFCG
ncbi:EAL domain-containing protein [Clostridium kluyveri]|uniref:PTS lactose transporter subunit IIC n=1 Tax=Clostridium kluyveri TaxID=1534 RepID=A0A1L5F400_CLOKL|nr:EAL domain-containing protein [Clostridium kluyveri]APM37723.1 PTS lactose transporter subunit IIC [Clostridium kluyveri]